MATDSKGELEPRLEERRRAAVLEPPSCRTALFKRRVGGGPIAWTPKQVGRMGWTQAIVFWFGYGERIRNETRSAAPSQTSIMVPVSRPEEPTRENPSQGRIYTRDHRFIQPVTVGLNETGYANTHTQRGSVARGETHILGNHLALTEPHTHLSTSASRLTLQGIVNVPCHEGQHEALQRLLVRAADSARIRRQQNSTLRICGSIPRKDSSSPWPIA